MKHGLRLRRLQIQLKLTVDKNTNVTAKICKVANNRSSILTDKQFFHCTFALNKIAIKTITTLLP